MLLMINYKSSWTFSKENFTVWCSCSDSLGRKHMENPYGKHLKPVAKSKNCQCIMTVGCFSPTLANDLAVLEFVFPEITSSPSNTWALFFLQKNINKWQLNKLFFTNLITKTREVKVFSLLPDLACFCTEPCVTECPHCQQDPSVARPFEEKLERLWSQVTFHRISYSL